MNDNEQPSGRAYSQNQEPILRITMLGISKEVTRRIVKNALCLLEPDTMLGSIALILAFIPFE